MDLITLAMANGYTDEQLGVQKTELIKSGSAGGIVQEPVTVRLDGYNTGKEIYEIDGEPFVMLFEEAISPENIRSLTVAVSGVEATIPANDLQVYNSTDGAVVSYGGTEFVVIVPRTVNLNGMLLKKGTWGRTAGTVNGVEFYSYLAGIEAMQEVVCQLNTEYLPEKVFEKSGVGDKALAEIPLVEGFGALAGSIGLIVGETYTVVLDSGEYTTVCKEGSLHGVSVIYLGNLGLGNGVESDNTGESFLCVEGWIDGDGVLQTLVIDMGEGAKAVILDIPTIKIRPEALPKGGFGWTEKNAVVILGETLVKADNNGTVVFTGHKLNLVSGETYQVELDGRRFECVAWQLERNGIVYTLIGDELLSIYPFVVLIGNGETIVQFSTGGSHLVAIWQICKTVHKIGTEYLPEGGFGHMTEVENSVIVFNGDIGNRENIDFSGSTYWVKMLDEVIDPSTITSVRIQVDGGDYEVTTIKTVTRTDTNGVNYTVVQGCIYADSWFDMLLICETNFMLSEYGAAEGTVTLTPKELSAGTYTKFNETTNKFVVTEVIAGTVEKPVTIREEFIPGAVLQVVELTTVPTAEGATLTDAESAVVAKIAAAGLPFIAKFGAAPMTITSVGAVMQVGSTFVISFWHESGTYTVTNDEDLSVWKFYAN